MSFKIRLLRTISIICIIFLTEMTYKHILFDNNDIIIEILPYIAEPIIDEIITLIESKVKRKGD